MAVSRGLGSGVSGVVRGAAWTSFLLLLGHSRAQRPPGPEGEEAVSCLRRCVLGSLGYGCPLCI